MSLDEEEKKVLNVYIFYFLSQFWLGMFTFMKLNLIYLGLRAILEHFSYNKRDWLLCISIFGLSWWWTFETRTFFDLCGLRLLTIRSLKKFFCSATFFKWNVNSLVSVFAIVTFIFSHPSSLPINLPIRPENLISSTIQKKSVKLSNVRLLLTIHHVSRTKISCFNDLRQIFRIFFEKVFKCPTDEIF